MAVKDTSNMRTLAAMLPDRWDGSRNVGPGLVQYIHARISYDNAQ